MTSFRCRLCFQPIPAASFSITDAPAGAQSFHDDADQAALARTSLKIAQCPACGLVQSLSPVVPYWRKAISAAGLSAAMQRYRAKQFADFVAAHRLAGKRLLEAGCGKGDMLPVLQAAGVIPVGLEHEGQEANPRRNGFGVIDGYPERGVPLSGSPYAAFVCLNFLEHAPDPRDFLSSLRASLEPGGVGLLEVPNYLQQRALGRAFDYVADHLSYFTPSTLRLAIELSGFDVRQLKETRGGENLEAWVHVRSPYDFVEDHKRIQTARSALVHLLREKGVKIAIWGASHQSLTLLSGLPRHAVHAVIDSAPFKQGKYMPGSGVSVIAPTTDAVQKVDHIVIIAAGYEPEIATTLRRDLSYRGTIWTFDGGDIKAYD